MSGKNSDSRLGAYYEEHNVKQTLQDLMREVVLHRPDDVISFLIDYLESGKKPRTPPPSIYVKQNTITTNAVKESHSPKSNRLKKVNQYVIDEVLGKGGFAIVYSCHIPSQSLLGDKTLKYAIKVLNKKRLARKRLGRFSNALKLLQGEMAIWKKLVHPNLVNLVEIIDDTEHDHCYLVAELMPGGTVIEDSVEKVKPLALPQAKSYTRQLLKALSYLHFQGIAHRDVKPGNMLVDREGIMKLTDFGVSQLFDGGRNNSQDDFVSNTAGTPHFMSPEMCTGTEKFHAKKHDIWAAGITLYMMVAGQPPFAGAKSIMDLFDTIAVGKVNYNLPIFEENRTLKECVQGLLRVDPLTRPTADEALAFAWLCETNEGARAAPAYEKLTVSQKEKDEAITNVHMDGLLNLKLFAHRAHVKVNHQ